VVRISIGTRLGVCKCWKKEESSRLHLFSMVEIPYLYCLESTIFILIDE
jgi:hypothetical protein